jgi:hypothetical protein
VDTTVALFVGGAGLLLGNLEYVVFVLELWPRKVKSQALLSQAGKINLYLIINK